MHENSSAMIELGDKVQALCAESAVDVGVIVIISTNGETEYRSRANDQKLKELLREAADAL